MGSSQSARKLTVNNEDGVIQISTDLVQRLAMNSRKPTSESNEKSVASEPVVSHQTTPTTTVQNSLPAEQGYLSNPYPEYTISAYKMQQKKDLELQQQEEYWQKRLQNLKLSHENIERIFKEEYQRAKDEVENAKSNKNIDLNTTKPACGADKEKVLRCYQENPREILKCSSLVQEFKNCVDLRRSALISAKC